MDFVAIDFETATSARTSACSLGICEVKNNTVINRCDTLIRPVPFEFNEYNVKIHGITPDMVWDAPTFAELWPDIRHMLDNRLVVAHNASFDINVLCKTLEHFGIEYPCFDYLCTVKLSQKAYPELESHKLNALGSALGISFAHHDACDDAYACAMVLLNILNDYNINSQDELTEHFNIGIGHIYPGFIEPCTKHKKRLRKKSVCPGAEI